MSEERKMILQMLADGKITPDQAENLLQAIEQGEPAPARPSVQWTAPKPPAPPKPPAQLSGGIVSGLGSLLEGLADQVSGLVDGVEARYQFPWETSGEFTEAEIPLQINVGNGHVEVAAWEEPGYQAQILVKARGADEEDARSRAEQAFDVRADERGFNLESRRTVLNGPQVNVRLLVPRDRLYRLEARTGNGRLTLTGVPLKEGTGTTGNGRITVIDGTAQQLHLRTGNGSITLAADVVDLEAVSGNGSVTVNPTGTRSQSLRVKTGNGSVTVDSRNLGQDVGFKVDASTGMGSIAVSRGDLVYERDSRSVASKHVIAATSGFEQAVAGVTVTARTGMGSIQVD